MKTKTFASVGSHPVQELCELALCENGFRKVENRHNADIVLVGSFDELREHLPHRCILLSSSLVYSDRDTNNNVRPRLPMKEEDCLVIPSPLGFDVDLRLKVIQSEVKLLNFSKDALVLRIFPVYGPTVSFRADPYTRIIHDVLNHKDPRVFHPGYHRTTLLYEEDFKECFLRFVSLKLKGCRGIYNVGSEFDVSQKRLADHALQITEQEDRLKLDFTECPPDFPWWEYPDLTRTKATTGWTPTTSIRKGLWTMWTRGT